MARVVFLGGNGHATRRLDRARRECDGALDLEDAPYPGFEGRERAPSLERFLDVVARFVEERETRLVYATGIGGLFAIALRASGALRNTPILLQGPVLWGLEMRLMPRLLRHLPAERIIQALFGSPAYQRRFARRHFEGPLEPEELRAFFEGYASCRAVGDMFAWLTPALLRDLEARLAARPGALAAIDVWWGGRDGVVSPEELAITERALRFRFPLRVIPRWGHYPMLDDPVGWATMLRDAVARARPLPGPGGPEAP